MDYCILIRMDDTAYGCLSGKKQKSKSQLFLLTVVCFENLNSSNTHRHKQTQMPNPTEKQWIKQHK